MSSLTDIDKRYFEKLFGMQSGYVRAMIALCRMRRRRILDECARSFFVNSDAMECYPS